jgi:hypothetical protein
LIDAQIDLKRRVFVCGPVAGVRFADPPFSRDGHPPIGGGKLFRLDRQWGVKLGRTTMSLVNLRLEADGAFSYSGLALQIATAPLMVLAVTLVLVRLTAPFAAPATDLDILAIAYS